MPTDIYYSFWWMNTAKLKQHGRGNWRFQPHIPPPSGLLDNRPSTHTFAQSSQKTRVPLGQTVDVRFPGIEKSEEGWKFLEGQIKHTHSTQLLILIFNNTSFWYTSYILICSSETILNAYCTGLTELIHHLLSNQISPSVFAYHFAL